MENFDWVKVSVDELKGLRFTPYPLTRVFEVVMPGVTPMEYFRAYRDYGCVNMCVAYAIRMSDSSWWVMTGTDEAWRCMPTRPSRP